VTRFWTTSLVAGLAAAGLTLPIQLEAATIYLPGTAPACVGCTFGTHLAEGANGSVAGVGGSGISVAGGSALDNSRTYIWDKGGWVDGSVTRGDADFAMLVWDLGAGNALDTVRLYTHQDHYSGGPIADPFVAQDVMEYSVWGSNDNQTFQLLSDVTAFNINGGGPGLPTYTFVGTEPSIVYRGGSAELGVINAYTRDYTFANAYRYYGIRTSTISRLADDADPEIDAVAFHQGPINPVPEPGTIMLFGVGATAALRRARRQFRS